YHGVPADDAQKIIESVVTRLVPAVEDFGGFVKVLRPSLKASEYVLLILYARGKERATHDQLLNWVHPKMQANLTRTLAALIHDRALVHLDYTRNQYVLTRLGTTEVETRRLHE